MTLRNEFQTAVPDNVVAVRQSNKTRNEFPAIVQACDRKHRLKNVEPMPF